MVEGGACEHHGDFIHPFRVVSPSGCVSVPSVKSRRKTHQTIWMLRPEQTIVKIASALWISRCSSHVCASRLGYINWHSCHVTSEYQSFRHSVGQLEARDFQTSTLVPLTKLDKRTPIRRWWACWCHRPKPTQPLFRCLTMAKKQLVDKLFCATTKIIIKHEPSLFNH